MRELVQITYDPSEVTYGRLLQIFFSVVHDPTQLNRQGPDIGTHYRSAIFPRSAEQAEVAKAYIAQLNQAGIFDAAIVTKIEADREFFAAKDYHQDYMIRNSDGRLYRRSRSTEGRRFQAVVPCDLSQ